MSEIRRIHVEIKPAQIESAISRGWVMWLGGAGRGCRRCGFLFFFFFFAAHVRRHRRASSRHSVGSVFAQLPRSAQHSTLPTCRCIPPAYLAPACLHAGACFSSGAGGNVAACFKTRPEEPDGAFHTYIHLVKQLVERQKLGWQLRKLSVCHSLTRSSDHQVEPVQGATLAT